MLSFSIFIIFGGIVSIPIGFLEFNCLINCLILVEVVFSKVKVEFNFVSDILYAYMIFIFIYDFRNGYLNVLTG